MTTIYKICEHKLWSDAERDGVFGGTAVDYADGYIHFSTAAQAAATAGKHFAGMTGLVIVAVDAEALGARAEMGALARRRGVSPSLREAAAHRGALGQADAARRRRPAHAAAVGGVEARSTAASGARAAQAPSPTVRIWMDFALF